MQDQGVNAQSISILVATIARKDMVLDIGLHFFKEISPMVSSTTFALLLNFDTTVAKHEVELNGIEKN